MDEKRFEIIKKFLELSEDKHMGFIEALEENDFSITAIKDTIDFLTDEEVNQHFPKYFIKKASHIHALLEGIDHVSPDEQFERLGYKKTMAKPNEKAPFEELVRFERNNKEKNDYSYIIFMKKRNEKVTYSMVSPKGGVCRDLHRAIHEKMYEMENQQ